MAVPWSVWDMLVWFFSFGAAGWLPPGLQQREREDHARCRPAAAIRGARRREGGDTAGTAQDGEVKASSRWCWAATCAARVCKQATLTN